MTVKRLIGSLPSQISRNKDLGSIAFQEHDSVRIKGGNVENIDRFSLDSISQQLGVSAYRIFVYDTRKDSDGGRWRQQIQHTSWYNEELGTSTRGTRREFPSVAILVATYSYGGSLTIYDGDDPSLPMWMVFNMGSGGWNAIYYGDQTTITGIHMLNGTLCVTTKPTSSYNYGNLAIINFINETIYKFIPNLFTLSADISRRNYLQPPFVDVSPGVITLSDQRFNDVKMTVLPGADISLSTGLPVPTVVTASDTYLCSIQENVNWSNGVPFKVRAYTHPYFSSARIDIRNDEVVINHNGTTSGLVGEVVQLPQLYDVVNGNITHGDNTPTETKRMYGYGAYLTARAYETPMFTRSYGNTNNAKVVFGKYPELYLAGDNSGVNSYEDGGLVKIHETPDYPGNGLQAYFNKDGTSGWMLPKTKIAVCGDTDFYSSTKSIIGTELVANGTFNTDLASWTLFTTNGSVAQTAGVMRITCNGVTSSGYPGASQAITCEIGKTYVATMQFSNNTTGCWFRVSTAAGTSGIDSDIINSTLTSGSGRLQFVASATTMYINIFAEQNDAGSVDIDTVSCKLAVADYSPAKRGLQVVGTVNRVPVNTNAELTAYTNFSASNYLVHPYMGEFFNSTTNSFCVMFWVKPNSKANQTPAIGIGHTDSDEFTTVWVNYAGGIYFDYGGGGGYSQSVSSSEAELGVWSHICCVVQANKKGMIYKNGVKLNTAYSYAAGSFLTSNLYNLYIGGNIRNNSALYCDASIALVKVSKGIPTDEQIKKIYIEELGMFAPNSKVGIYGGSSNVSALSYDKDTNIVHVGTNFGRSSLKGFNRVDTSTVPILNSIASSSGLVVEQ